MSVDLPLKNKDKIKFKRKNVPHKPGCYLFKDKNHQVLYVGKAKDLKKRVNSYWSDKNTGDPLYNQKIKKLIRISYDLDFFFVENEAEALILENELIKKHKPKFNAMLKDDKSFPWVQITNEKYPRIKVVRNPQDHGMEHQYLGPFVNVKKLKEMIEFIRKIFPFCTCNSEYRQCHRKRPCTYYQIGLCPAPCLNKISKDAYSENISNVKKLLVGNIEEIEEIIREKMQNLSQKLEYEEAAVWRDRLQALRMFTIKQSVFLYDSYEEEKELDKNLNQKSGEKSKIKWKLIDIVSHFQNEEIFGLIILHIKNGRLVGKTPYMINIENKISSDLNYFTDIFQQHYLREYIGIPDEIYVKKERAEKLVKNMKKYLDEKNIQIKTPNDKEKIIGLLKIASKNIKILVNQKQSYGKFKKIEKENKISEINKGLKEFKEILDLNSVPMYIEAFDMSHTQGSDYVGSKVSFFEGRPLKNEYRRYKIKSGLDYSDDVSAMKEVLTRRYKKLILEKQSKPDLIIVDGGKPQINMTHNLLDSLNLINIPHIGISKPEGRSEINKSPKIVMVKDDKFIEKILPLKSPALHILQHIRDEAHRFAINYHRKLRQKRTIHSKLDKISGIGPIRRKKLLKFFGSVKNVQKASLDELSNIIGKKLAYGIKKYFLDKSENQKQKRKEENRRLKLKKKKKD